MAERNETEKQDILTDHMYDGILEYDNPAPGWWHLIFLGTIVFSVLYVLIYHLSPMVTTPQQQVAAAARRENLEKFGEIANMPMGDEKMLLLMGSEDWLKTGARLFQSKCVICHGPDGQGLVGPNLTDDKYKNVRTLTDVYAVVRDGAGAGQMPSQKAALSDSQIAVVAAYAASLRGKNLPSVKELPEEIPIDPWPTRADTAPTEPVGNTGASEGGA